MHDSYLERIYSITDSKVCVCVCACIMCASVSGACVQDVMGIVLRRTPSYLIRTFKLNPGSWTTYS